MRVCVVIRLTALSHGVRSCTGCPLCRAQASGFFFRRLKNAVYVDGSAAQLGNEDADAEWSIRSHGSLRAVLDSCAELKPEASQLWKLTVHILFLGTGY